MQPFIHQLTTTATVFLANASDTINQSATKACGTSCNITSADAIFAEVTNTLIFLIGSISVIMIIVGGLRFVLSNGDSKAAASARNTILYAVVGVVVAIASYAIVTFVTKYIH